MKKFLLLSIALCGLTVLISGCARNISSSTYDARKIGETNDTYECVVVKVRKVAIEEGDYLEDNHTGAMMGAVAGGIGGSFIGGGNARYATAAGGAILGGLAGALAEKGLKSQDGLEYIVRLNSGKLKTVVQGMDSPLSVGQPAILIVDHKGRSRVIAR
ncbi:hypothetical protein FACS1894122_14700 [Alphaproteobacteria bacterium]|nr:hypothetical protein FACS1894122_14700 [Alphaproteobacteria bacterium]